MAFTRSGVRFPSPPFFWYDGGNIGIVGRDGPGYFACPHRGNAGIAQLVEHNLAKVGVAGSNPVSRSARINWRSRKRRGVEQSGSSPGS